MLPGQPTSDDSPSTSPPLSPTHTPTVPPLPPSSIALASLPPHKSSSNYSNHAMSQSEISASSDTPLSSSRRHKRSAIADDYPLEEADPSLPLIAGATGSQDDGVKAALRDLYLVLTHRALLDPQSTRKLWWDWLIIMFVLYNAFIIPYYIAFSYSTATLLEPFDIITTIAMAIDIYLTFRTGFIDFTGNIVYDTKKIARRYWNRGLILDILGTFPFEIFASLFTFGDPLFVSNCLKFPGVIRATRLMYNERIEIFNSPLHRIAKLTFSFFYLAHLFGSVFFFVGTTQPGDQSWVKDTGLLSASNTDQYIASLYWALTTMVTVGYGDIHATTVYEQAVCIPILLLSALIYALIFGNMAYAIETLTATVRRYQTRMDNVKEFIRVYELPLELQRKLYNYNEEMWKQNKGFEMEYMLRYLPTSVKAEVLLFINESLIERVPLLKQCSDRFLEAIILRMSSCVCLPGDYIFKQGEKSREMYFIRTGTVEIRMEDSVTGVESVISRLHSFSEAPFFGEISLLLGETRTASARAHTKCVLTALSQQDFFEVLSMFPDEENSLRETAAARLQADIDREQKALAKKSRRASIRASSEKNLTAQGASGTPVAGPDNQHLMAARLSSVQHLLNGGVSLVQQSLPPTGPHALHSHPSSHAPSSIPSHIHSRRASSDGTATPLTAVGEPTELGLRRSRLNSLVRASLAANDPLAGGNGLHLRTGSEEGGGGEEGAVIAPLPRHAGPPSTTSSSSSSSSSAPSSSPTPPTAFAGSRLSKLHAKEPWAKGSPRVRRPSIAAPLVPDIAEEGAGAGTAGEKGEQAGEEGEVHRPPGKRGGFKVHHSSSISLPPSISSPTAAAAAAANGAVSPSSAASAASAASSPAPPVVHVLSSSSPVPSSGPLSPHSPKSILHSVALDNAAAAAAAGKGEEKKGEGKEGKEGKEEKEEKEKEEEVDILVTAEEALNPSPKPKLRPQRPSQILTNPGVIRFTNLALAGAAPGDPIPLTASPPLTPMLAGDKEKEKEKEKKRGAEGSPMPSASASKYVFGEEVDPSPRPSTLLLPPGPSSSPPPSSSSLSPSPSATVPVPLSPSSASASRAALLDEITRRKESRRAPSRHFTKVQAAALAGQMDDKIKAQMEKYAGGEGGDGPAPSLVEQRRMEGRLKRAEQQLADVGAKLDALIALTTALTQHIQPPPYSSSSSSSSAATSPTSSSSSIAVLQAQLLSLQQQQQAAAAALSSSLSSSLSDSLDGTGILRVSFNPEIRRQNTDSSNGASNSGSGAAGPSN